MYTHGMWWKYCMGISIWFQIHFLKKVNSVSVININKYITCKIIMTEIILFQRIWKLESFLYFYYCETEFFFYSAFDWSIHSVTFVLYLKIEHDLYTYAKAWFFSKEALETGRTTILRLATSYWLHVVTHTYTKMLCNKHSDSVIANNDFPPSPVCRINEYR